MGKKKMSVWQFNSKKEASIIQYRNQQKESPRLKGAKLNLIRSMGLICYRGGVVSNGPSLSS